MTLLPAQTVYSNHVASDLARMGDFGNYHLWAVTPGSCQLTRDLNKATTPEKVHGRVSVRIAPLVVAIIVVAFMLYSATANRQLVENGGNIDPQRVSEDPWKVESMAECQYGCTGSENYERCVVGCVEVATEDSCDAQILCDDCDLVYPEPHSLRDKCTLMCSPE